MERLTASGFAAALTASFRASGAESGARGAFNRHLHHALGAAAAGHDFPDGELKAYRTRPNGIPKDGRIKLLNISNSNVNDLFFGGSGATYEYGLEQFDVNYTLPEIFILVGYSEDEIQFRIRVDASPGTWWSHELEAALAEIGFQVAQFARRGQLPLGGAGQLNGIHGGEWLEIAGVDVAPPVIMANGDWFSVKPIALYFTSRFVAEVLKQQHGERVVTGAA